MSEMTGYIEYRGYAAMQHADSLPIFKDFIREIRPRRVVEIGTAHGGLTLAIRDILNDVGLTATEIRSFDVACRSWYDDIRAHNIEIVVENIFNATYTELAKPDLLIPFIRGEGTVLVLCDGGFKVGEFNLIAPYMKVGDYIMAHDYVDTEENFQQNYFEKIWNWQEIRQCDIQETCDKYRLADCNQEAFSSVVWACRRKQD